jgi:hypothetical protein
MRYIDCRLAHISDDQVISCCILPSLRDHELVPGQLYYGQDEWRPEPLRWVDQTWRRTKAFRQLAEECYLPDPQYRLGAVGFRWLIFRFRPEYPISQLVGHRPTRHLKLLRQLTEHLVLKKTD